MPATDATRRSQGRGRLERLSAAELATRVTASSILVQPIGAVEQHGPHLPLGTDLILAEAIADAALDRCGDDLDIWRLPAIGYKSLTPSDTPTPIVAFALPDAAATAKALQAGKVAGTIIANENRLRLSVSVFNNHDDINRVVAVLSGKAKT